MGYIYSIIEKDEVKENRLPENGECNKSQKNINGQSLLLGTKIYLFQHDG
jgi:hypothetical protein